MSNHNIEEIFHTISELIIKNVENDYTIGTRKNPVLEMKSIELSAKRGEGDGFFTCCCLC